MLRCYWGSPYPYISKMILMAVHRQIMEMLALFRAHIRSLVMRATESSGVDGALKIARLARLFVGAILLSRFPLV